MIKEIYARLGFNAKIDSEQRRLVERIAQVLDRLVEGAKVLGVHGTLWQQVSFALGEPLNPYFSSAVRNQNIERCILICEIALGIVRKGYPSLYERFTESIEEAMQYCALNPGFNFHDGKFTRAGAEELDRALVLETLTWLENFPQTRELFENSLGSLLRKNLKDAITNAYSSLESLVKTILKKDKPFDSDEMRKEFVRFVGLEEHWGQMLFLYSKTAHEFSSRHGQREGNEPNTELTYELAEFYVYMTGTFIRLIAQRIKT